MMSWWWGEGTLIGVRFMRLFFAIGYPHIEGGIVDNAWTWTPLTLGWERM